MNSPMYWSMLMEEHVSPILGERSCRSDWRDPDSQQVVKLWVARGGRLLNCFALASRTWPRAHGGDVYSFGSVMSQVCCVRPTPLYSGQSDRFLRGTSPTAPSAARNKSSSPSGQGTNPDDPHKLWSSTIEGSAWSGVGLRLMPLDHAPLATRAVEFTKDLAETIASAAW